MIHEHDGSYQVVCGDVHNGPEDGRVVGFGHVVDRLPNERDLPLLRPGEQAELFDGEWHVSPLPPDDEDI